MNYNGHIPQIKTTELNCNNPFYFKSIAQTIKFRQVFSKHNLNLIVYKQLNLDCVIDLK